MIFELIVIDGSGLKCAGQFRTESKAREIGNLMIRQNQGRPLNIDVRHEDGTFSRMIPF